MLKLMDKKIFTILCSNILFIKTYVFILTSPVLSGDNDQVVEMCVGLVKLDDERFVYMADDCDSEHNFVCDTSKHTS